MAEYIEREAVVRAFCEHCRDYVDKCTYDGTCEVDIIATVPTADVQPDSYVNAIYAELAELYGSPCSNFSHQDEYMLENGKCDDCCGDISDKECWKRYLEMKLKQ